MAGRHSACRLRAVRLRVRRVVERPRVRAAFLSALLVLAVAAVLPGPSSAEHASEPSSVAAALLDAGRDHTCAVLEGGSVRCWGFGGDGELGYGNVQTIGDDETPGTAGPVNLGAGGPVTSISAGHFHTCVVQAEGNVRCWGFGRNGQVGHEGINSVGDNESPGSIDPVQLGAGATEVTAGGAHSCALLTGGQVRCWGYGFYGALGHGGGDPNAEIPSGASPPGGHPEDIGDDETPLEVGPPIDFGNGRTALAVSAGGYHTCALLDDQTVRCWGLAQAGQLGYGDRVNVAEPNKVGAVDLGGHTARAISAGEVHTCALLDDGSVRCWGAALEGRLGFPGQTPIGDTETPGSVPPVDLGGRAAVAISAGSNHTCARLDDGSVRCWGSGFQGRLGYGNTNNIGDDPGEAPGAFGPVSLGEGRSAAAVSAGGRHTCARLDGATDVVCWGYGGNGRLGYCNQRNVGDDELPAAVGPVPVDVAVRAPSSAYPGCVRPPRASGGSTPPPAGGSRPAPAVSPLAAQAQRRRAFRSCLAEAASHARREIRRARRSSRGARARLKRHIKRHRASKRRACLRRHGRTPGRVTGLTARATSRTAVVLRFKAAGTDGNRPPAARTYVVKQSTRPIRGRRGFRRAQTLCKGRCRFAVTAVGAEVSLRVKDLRRRTRYYYAVAARDNVSRRVGPRSRAVRVRTR